MNSVSILRVGLWALVALLVGAVVALVFLYGQGGRNTAEGPFGTPFALVDQNGAAITEADLTGKPSAVFFGFTHCPEVCPTTLYELAGYQRQLKQEGKDLRVVFVTVDPERDTPEILKDYVEAIGADITAITGAPDKIAAMLRGWGVYSAKVGEGPDYSMDHTATTFLLDADGALAGTLAYGEKSDTARAKLDRLVGL
ncbi:SCO family protein [Aurantimonas sp. E1-2-R+4]|uniref:SCO family protein n=1 Tax=Aurantimonas sp. E1-2-R+4 TaxID=3113714 RepID=UPI002F95BE46